MDKHTSCSNKSLEERPVEEFQVFNELPADSDSDENENPVNNSDSDEMFDLPVSDDDVQLSSPSNSLNSDVDQRWYALRGRWGVNMIGNNHEDINNRQLDNRVPEHNQQPQQPQEEEETDFLEMDFEPDTNSEIENEATLPINASSSSNTNSYNFLNRSLPLQLPQHDFRLPPLLAASPTQEPDHLIRPAAKSTGAKPKQLSTNSRPQKVSKHITDGDDTFKMPSAISNNNNSLTILDGSSRIYTNGDDIYNLGASSSRTSNDRLHNNHDTKIHKSPSKSSSHNHKHLRLHEEQNDLFLFEIEPIKPRNSVTIYTTNCDEKILIDALVSFWLPQVSLEEFSNFAFQTSLNLQPNRELISAFFKRSKPSVSTAAGSASNCELNLVDYIIYRSKLNCNYLKLIELIQKACKVDDDEDGYGDKKVEINFYPVSLQGVC